LLKAGSGFWGKRLLTSLSLALIAILGMTALMILVGAYFQ
jgi:hypothetical protein